MRPLILLWGCLVLPGYEALEGPKEISGFEGDTVSLQCTYSDELRENRKYWCKEGWLLFSHCSGTIYVGADGQEVTEGRVSIRDSRQELQFTVTLRDLTLQDAGEYRCGVQRLGLDETFLVSLLVSPASPGRHRAVTTAKQGKTVAKASPFTGSLPSGFAGTSPYARTSPYAGISRPAVQLDSTSAKHTSPVPSSGSSKPRVSIPMVHILAPVLVLLTLLLAAGLITFGSYWLRWRKKAQLAAETQRNKKVFLSHMPLGNGLVSEDAMINPAGPTGPLANSYVEIRCLSQTTEEEEASPQDPKGDILPVPPVHMAEEEMGFSKFTSV